MSETVDKIMERLGDNLPTRYDISTGSYTYDIERSIATEFANAYDMLESKEIQYYASTATGKYLDMRAEEFGIERKSATYATGSVTVYGASGSAVSIGDTVAAGNVFFEIMENATIGSDGSVTVGIRCRSATADGNVDSGKINRFPVSISGCTAVTNLYATSGGSDEETDEALRERLLEFLSRPVTSGNKYQYVSWAKSVDGVGDAKCFPLWNGNGTVKVVIVGNDNKAPDAELISNVQKYISDVAPIGASVTVAPADETKINISCKASMDADVTENIIQSIKEYLSEVSFSEGAIVSYAKIGQAILNTDGVTDYEDLTVNGGRENVTIKDTDIAVVGEVVLNV